MTVNLLAVYTGMPTSPCGDLHFVRCEKQWISAAYTCTLASNNGQPGTGPSQLDADGDGYGNICDADLNNSGTVTTADFAILRARLNTAPGPSGLVCAGTVPCP